MYNALKRLRADCRAATAVEYGLIVSLIFLAAAGAISAFGDAASAMWEFIREEAMNNL